MIYQFFYDTVWTESVVKIFLNYLNFVFHIIHIQNQEMYILNYIWRSCNYSCIWIIAENLLLFDTEKQETWFFKTMTNFSKNMDH